MAEKKKKSFRLSYRANIVVSTNITAASLEDAIASGKEIKLNDLISFSHSECDDADCKLVGICDDSSWNTDIN